MKRVRFEADQRGRTRLRQGRKGVDLVMKLRNLQYGPTFFAVKKKKKKKIDLPIIFWASPVAQQ